MLLSVVVPCYNEEANVQPFFRAVTEALQAFENDYELVFVNDGSADHTYEELAALYEKNRSFMTVVSFSRNFGKEAALLAGLQAAKGDYVAIVDADLQQDPAYIPEMYAILQNNPQYDSVAAYQDVRNESKTLSLFKDCFYKLINKLTEISLFRSASDFRLLKRSMVDAITALPERSRFSKGIFSWVGFQTYYMPYTVKERNSGTSKWNFLKLTRYALDGIVCFSNKPLLICLLSAAVCGLIAVGLFAAAVIGALLHRLNIALLVILAFLFLLSAWNFLCLSVFSEYLSKIYTESKNRPVYVVKTLLEREESN